MWLGNEESHPGALEGLGALQEVSGEKGVLLGEVGNKPKAWGILSRSKEKPVGTQETGCEG